jgi:hypothetical protein
VQNPELQAHERRFLREISHRGFFERTRVRRPGAL